LGGGAAGAMNVEKEQGESFPTLLLILYFAPAAPPPQLLLKDTITL